MIGHIACDDATLIPSTDGLTIARSGGDVVKASGEVLEPAEVADIVYSHIQEERFLIMPHTEVHTYEKRKVEDRDRWLSGMRRLQAKVLGG